ncbi:DMT family transporter [Humibacter antri]
MTGSPASITSARDTGSLGARPESATARSSEGIAVANRIAAGARGAVSMVLVGSVVALTGGVLRYAPVFAVQALRYAAAAVALAVFARVFRARLVMPKGAEWFWIAAGAATGLVVFNVALVIGTAHADPAVLGAAVACVPIVLAVASPLMHRSAPSVRVVVAAVIVAGGAMAVEGGGHADAIGIAMAVILMICEALFTLFGARVIGRIGAWTFSLGTTSVAALGCAVVSVFLERSQWHSVATLPVGLGIVYAGAIATATAYVLWFSSVGRVGAAITGLTSGFAPPTAALLGTIFGSAMPTWIGWLGMVAIACGLAIGFAEPRTHGVAPVADALKKATRGGTAGYRAEPSGARRSAARE